jgi:hypothetical protein
MMKRQCGGDREFMTNAATRRNSMRSPTFSVSEFVDAVKDLSYPEIIWAADQEVRTVEHTAYVVKGARDVRKRGGPQYAATLKSLLFLLQTGMKPAGVDSYTLALFRPIVENLVKKNQLKPTVLQVFEG